MDRSRSWLDLTPGTGGAPKGTRDRNSSALYARIFQTTRSERGVFSRKAAVPQSAALKDSHAKGFHATELVEQISNVFKPNVGRDSVEESDFATLAEGRTAVPLETNQDEDLVNMQELTRNWGSKTSLHQGSTSTNDIRDVQLAPREIMLKQKLRGSEEDNSGVGRNYQAVYKSASHLRLREADTRASLNDGGVSQSGVWASRLDPFTRQNSKSPGRGDGSPGLVVPQILNQDSIEHSIEHQVIEIGHIMSKEKAASILAV